MEAALLHRGPLSYGHLLSPDIDEESRSIITAFAYGSISDLSEETASKLPEKELKNLRAISTIAAITSHGLTLNYDTITRCLRLANDDEVEKAVLYGIAGKWFDATIDQCKREVSFTTWAARETSPSRIDEMESSLDSWIGSSEKTLIDAEAKAVAEDDACAAAKKAKQETDDAYAAALLVAKDHAANEARCEGMMLRGGPRLSASTNGTSSYSNGFSFSGATFKGKFKGKGGLFN